MEISLIRHGKSLWDENKLITCREFKNWSVKYDENGVFEQNIYPYETLKKIETANLIITSDLERSIKSAQFLNPKIKGVSDPIFRETDLPSPLTNMLGLKLKPAIWAAALRCLWFGGYSSNCESIGEAKNRAKIASDLLINYVQEHKEIVLVGHGFFNLLIAKELQKKGWKANRKLSSKHWHTTTFKYPNSLD